MKITVTGVDQRVAASIAGRDYAEVATSLEEIGGSRLVVLGSLERLDELCVRAPAAVVVVTAEPLVESCERVYATTLFPRARVLGVEADGLEPVVDAIVLDRRELIDCIARGQDGFGPARARLGAAGIVELAG